MTYWI